MAEYRRSNHTSQLTDFTLLEDRELKDVWQGRPYPVFSVDRTAQDEVVRALKWIRKQTPADVENIIEPSRACVLAPGWPFGLMLPESSISAFTERRAALEQARLELAEERDDYETRDAFTDVAAPTTASIPINRPTS